MADKLELALKRKIRERYSPYWSEAYEPGTGSGNGYPDLQLMDSNSKELLPVELKIGDIKNGRLFSHEVRPAQVVWHHQFCSFGARSALLVGIPPEKYQKEWECWVFPGFWGENWRLGYDLNDGFHLAKGFSTLDLQAMVHHFLYVTGQFANYRSLQFKK
jgi:hypothetical protein